MVLKVSQQYNDHDSTKIRHKHFLKFLFSVKNSLYALGTHFYKVNQIFIFVNVENLKFLKMISEWFEKFRSSK